MKRRNDNQPPLLVVDRQSATDAEFWRVQREIMRAYRELTKEKKHER